MPDIRRSTQSLVLLGCLCGMTAQGAERFIDAEQLEHYRAYAKLRNRNG